MLTINKYSNIYTTQYFQNDIAEFKKNIEYFYVDCVLSILNVI